MICTDRVRRPRRRRASQRSSWEVVSDVGGASRSLRGAAGSRSSPLMCSTG